MNKFLRTITLLGAICSLVGCVSIDQKLTTVVKPRPSDPYQSQETRYDPRKPFNPDELKGLLKKDHLSGKEQQHVQYLLLHAGAVGDESFRHAFDLDTIQRNPNYEMIFAAYRYSALGEQKALDEIIDANAAHSFRGGDTAERLVLPWIDEWDRTIAAQRRHATGINDGTAGMAFTAVPPRSALFPESLASYRQLIATKEKLLHELIGVVAHSPKLNYDYGMPLYYDGPLWNKSDGNGAGLTTFRVKELPRTNDTPLWFIHLGSINLSKANLEKQRSFVFEKQGNSFVEVTDSVLLDKWHLDYYLVPSRENLTIMRRSYTQTTTDTTRLRAEVRASDLIWENGAFREAGFSEIEEEGQGPWWKEKVWTQ